MHVPPFQFAKKKIEKAQKKVQRWASVPVGCRACGAARKAVAAVIAPKKISS